MVKTLQARVNESFYERVERISQAMGYPTVSDFVRNIICEKVTQIEEKNGFHVEEDELEQARRQIGNRIGD